MSKLLVGQLVNPYLPHPSPVETGLCFLSLSVHGREGGMLVCALRDCDIDSFGLTHVSGNP